MVSLKMTGNDEGYSACFLAFVGELVTITTTTKVTTPQTSIEFESVPIFYEGLLLDEDSDYFFLGEGDQISQAIKKSEVLHIMLFDKVDPLKQFLEELPSPKNDQDLN